MTNQTQYTLEGREDIMEIGELYRNELPRASATVSLISSTIIIYIIMRSLTRLNSIYHRIMFGMSVGDIMMSLAIAFTHLPMPKPGISEAVDIMFDESDQGRRIGTVGTCELQGFFFIVGANVNYMYFGTLSCYYYCVIVKTMRDQAIRKRVEPLIHLIPVSVGLFSGIIFYIIGAYNPGLAWCTMTTSPYNCDSDCDSQRMSPENNRRIVTPVTLFAAASSLLSMIFFLTCVYCKIHSLNKVVSAKVRDEDSEQEHHERIQDTHGLKRMTAFAQAQEQPEISMKSLRTIHLVANKTVAFQSLAYVVAWLCTIGIALVRILMKQVLEKNNTSRVILLRIQLFLQPSQGFFNLLIFLGFKIFYQKKLNPTMSYSTVLHRIFFESTSDPIFLSRMTIVAQGNGKDVRGIEVEGEFLDLNDSASLGNMDMGSMNSSVIENFPIGSGVANANAANLPKEIAADRLLAFGISLKPESSSSDFSGSGMFYSSGFSSTREEINHNFPASECRSDASTLKR